MTRFNFFSRPQRPKIFISYRRDDSEAHTDILYERLVQHFGREQIFFDIDNIPVGHDFVEVIESAVNSCDMLLAVIGKQWLLISDGQSRRLDNPDDFVRLEIGSALRSKIPVVPVLVQGAGMPRPEDLPDELKGLARRHAFQISRGHRHEDLDRFIRELEKVLADEATNRSARRASQTHDTSPTTINPKVPIVFIVAVVLCVTAGLIWLNLARTPTSTQNSALSTPATSTPTIQPSHVESTPSSTALKPSNAGAQSDTSPAPTPLRQSPNIPRSKQPFPRPERIGRPTPTPLESAAEAVRKKREAALRALDQ